jgi:hypothetical protein
MQSGSAAPAGFEPRAPSPGFASTGPPAQVAV